MLQVILTEQFDEGLMVLRRLLGWQMIDMTYCSMYETKKGATRYDGKPLVNVPHFEDLPYAVRCHGRSSCPPCLCRTHNHRADKPTVHYRLVEAASVLMYAGYGIMQSQHKPCHANCTLP